MIEDLVRQVDNLQRTVDGLVLPEMSRDMISPFQALPGLVGFWPMSSVQRSTGNVADLGGQTRTLTYNGNPTYNIYNNLVPYLDLDGTGDFLSRADETDLDILGTETVFASGVRGLACGGYYWWDNKDTVNGDGMLDKTDLVNQRSYELFSGTTPIFRVSSNGTAVTTVTSTVTHTTSAWYFVVARYTPSTELAIFVSEPGGGLTKTINTTSIPASIFNSTSQLEIGRINLAATALDGRVALQFLCANALPDALISSLFQQTRVLFGV